MTLQALILFVLIETLFTYVNCVPVAPGECSQKPFIALCFAYALSLDYGMNWRQICKHDSREHGDVFLPITVVAIIFVRVLADYYAYTYTWWKIRTSERVWRKNWMIWFSFSPKSVRARKKIVCAVKNSLVGTTLLVVDTRHFLLGDLRLVFGK